MDTRSQAPATRSKHAPLFTLADYENKAPFDMRGSSVKSIPQKPPPTIVKKEAYTLQGNFNEVFAGVPWDQILSRLAAPNVYLMVKKENGLFRSKLFKFLNVEMVCRRWTSSEGICREILKKNPIGQPVVNVKLSVKAKPGCIDFRLRADDGEEYCYNIDLLQHCNVLW